MSDLAERYLVWDWPVRLIHWAFPIGIAFMWWSGEQGEMDLHSKVGYALLVLVATRWVWGLVGSQHARFTSFLAGPRRCAEYLKSPAPTVGHNPLGGWSTIAMLLSVLVQAITGLFSSDDILFEGPLAYWGGDMSDTLAQVHDVNWTILQALIVLHLMAIAWYQWGKHQPLIQTMVFGKSKDKACDQAPRPVWWALVISAGFAGVLWWVVSNAPSAPTYYF